MPRRPNLDRPTRLEISLPESERARLDLHLFSALEGRVPLNAYSEFFRARLREYFETARLEVAAGEVVTGKPETIQLLEKMLHGTSTDE